MTISKCPAADWPALIDIFIEMENYYHDLPAITPQEMGDYLRDSVFNPTAGTSVYISRQDGEITGFACVSIMFPAPRFSGQMFIKELFVSAQWRGKGIGKSLMAHLAAEARAAGCLRLDWLSDKHDSAAQRFYQSLGGEVIESVSYYRLADETLHRLAESDNRQ